MFWENRNLNLQPVTENSVKFWIIVLRLCVAKTALPNLMYVGNPPCRTRCPVFTVHALLQGKIFLVNAWRKHARPYICENYLIVQSFGYLELIIYSFHLLQFQQKSRWRYSVVLSDFCVKKCSCLCIVCLWWVVLVRAEIAPSLGNNTDTSIYYTMEFIRPSKSFVL